MSPDAFPSPDVHDPPIQSADLPAVGGCIGPALEDFQVDEVPLYEPSGSGDHWYVRLKKRGATTREALQAIARAAQIDSRELGSAGMKDKHAVTTQWVSIPARAPIPPDRWDLDSRLEVLEVARHSNKLRTGHLKANRFRIQLVEAHPDGEERGHAIAERLRSGLLNYFGSQRFGHGGQNLARALSAIADGPKRRMSRFDRKLLPSVIQAEIFNRYTTARARLGLDRIIAGEVLRLAGSGSVFEATRPDEETPRWVERDVIPTGPILGPRMRPASAEAAKLEEEAVAELGLDRTSLRPFGKQAAGTRRDLVIFLEGFVVERTGKQSLQLEFTLPPGSYATQVLRELTRAPFLSGSRQPKPADRQDTAATNE